MKNGAFEPNIAPRKIRSKLCSHSKISPEKKKKQQHEKTYSIKIRTEKPEKNIYSASKKYIEI